MLKKVGKAAGRFLKGEDGVLTILGLLFFVMLLAIGGLSIDLGRLYSERGQMQSYVDHAALSSAAQLDRNSNAITRAMCAVVGLSNASCTATKLITGADSFSMNPGNLDVQQLTFMSSLDPAWKPLDPTPFGTDGVLCTYTAKTSSWTPAACNTDPDRNQNAQFVEVRARPRAVRYLLLPLIDFIGNIFGAPSTIAGQSLAVRATAGFKQELCDNVPLMVCNPDEATYGPGADFDVNDRDKGKQLFGYGQSSGGGTIGPGMFGLLATYGSGGNAIRDSFSMTNPNTICTSDTVPPKNGVTVGPSAQGINVRFDKFDGPMNPTDPASDVTAPVVTKGLVTTKNGTQSCAYSQSTDTMPFPRDNCFMANPPSSQCFAYDSAGVARMGNACWGRAAYWTTNHPGEPQPAGYIDPTNCSKGWTRYQTYLYEISHPVNASGLDETSRPMCSTATPDPSRRVFTIAVVNCESTDITKSFVPIKAYAQVFLTEPVGNTDWNDAKMGGLQWPNNIQNADTYVEIIGVVHPGDAGGKLHQFPVLYR